MTGQATGNGRPKRTGEDRIFTVPNVISFIRLLLIPVFFVVYVDFHNIPVGVILFVIAACTDWVDGMVARKTGSVTKVGRVLDPLVDRFLLIFGVDQAGHDHRGEPDHELG